MSARRLSGFGLVLITLLTAACNSATKTSSSTTSRATTSTSSPGPSKLHGKRYCEVLLLTKLVPAVADVYNSYPLNDCPADRWTRLDAKAIAAREKVPLAVLNGPRYWLMDGIEQSEAAVALLRKDFGGIAMIRRATVAVGSIADAAKPYSAHAVNRSTVFIYDAGRMIYELTAPDGSRYVMQTYSQQKDPALTESALAGLGPHLTLPLGWTYAARTLAAPLRVVTTASAARVLQDDFANSYSLETGSSAAIAKKGPVLSAFFGLDHALPALAAAICPEAPGEDGLVVNVADELDPAAIRPSQWIVVTAAGRRAAPLCATLRPATDPGERRTVLLIGDLGSVSDPPHRVEITEALPTVDPTRRAAYRGAGFEPVTPLSAGPSLVIAERVARPTLGGAVTGPDGCPSATAQVLRVAWSGGVTRADGAPTSNADAARYHVTMSDADGATRVVSPSALADVNDNDNYHELCLAVAGMAASVAVDANAFVDPNHDLNPPTLLAVAGARP